MSKVRQIQIVAGLWLSLAVFLMATNPQKLPVMMLFVAIVWVFICFYATLYVLITLRANRLRKPRIQAAILAAIPGFLLLLQSIGQLSPRDILIVLAIGVFGIFYSQKFSIL